MQNPSQGVLTDYDIADEVGNQLGQSARQHQLEFRDKYADDNVREDTNIDDMKRKLLKEITESRGAARMISESGVLTSGQTAKTGGVGLKMELGEISDR